MTATIAAKRKKTERDSTRIAAYLRSIDIELDAIEPNRIAHFMPSEKSVKLIRQLYGEEEDRTLIVVAPYGSGKSIAASYALHMIENREDSHQAIGLITKRLKSIDTVLAGNMAKRMRKRTRPPHGLVVSLSGPVPELFQQVKESTLRAFKRFKLGRETRSLAAFEVKNTHDLIPFLKATQRKATELGFDRIALLWDEFGKHLEFLVQNGKTSDLFHVQKLAEYVSRAREPMSFSVLMHMGLLHYAGSLSQSARAEWRKVEGRFTTLDYVDDSKHIYELISRLIETKRTTKRPDSSIVRDWVRFSRDHKLFRDFDDHELEALFSESYPFTPPALFLLPRLMGRIAQNERTLFHFIEHWDSKSEVRPADLFDYFSPLLKADISTGGTHRQWLEANSALEKLDGEKNHEDVVKTACLFGLGIQGRVGGASFELLCRAWCGYTGSEGNKEPVRDLINRKLLLYRQYKDEVAVWHGSDIDLRGHLASEKSRRGSTFDLVSFLNEQSPPPIWRPLSYNTQFSIRRYFSSQFMTFDEFDKVTTDESVDMLITGDGHILYLLPNSPDELEKSQMLAADCREKRLIIAIPREPTQLAEAALEVQCLYAMQTDQDLVASDPLALAEIRQLTSDAEAHLTKLLHRCTNPSAGGPTWLSMGSASNIESPSELREYLSKICGKIYSRTPILNNELINKNHPSAVIVNSRKKCIIGILERLGSDDLGLTPTTPDASMFRSLLKNPGLYVQLPKGLWGFAKVSDKRIKDPGLRATWSAIGEFIATPTSERKNLSVLKQKLESPPIGLRQGVFPILLAAGIKAFGGMTTIRRDGNLIEDLLPTTLEEMASHPGNFTFESYDLKQTQLKLAEDFAALFNNDIVSPTKGEALQDACFHFIEWREALPESAKSVDFDDSTLNEFRDLVFTATDPIIFLTKDLYSLLNVNGARSSNKRTTLLTQWKASLEHAHLRFYDEIKSALRVVFDLNPNDDFASSIYERACLFPKDFVSNLSNSNQISSYLLRRLQLPDKTTEEICVVVAQLLTEKRVFHFTDRIMEQFRSHLQEAMRSINHEATWYKSSLFGGELREWITKNRRRKLRELFTELAHLESEEEARSFVDSILIKKDTANS